MSDQDLEALKKIFKEKYEDEKVKDFIPYARICALEEWKRGNDIFSELPKLIKDSDIDKWCFFFAVASLYLTTTFLEDENLEILSAAVGKHLDEWNPKGMDCLDNLVEFVNNCDFSKDISVEEIRSDVENAIGIWFVWNLINEQPEDNLLKDACIIGKMIGVYTDGHWNGKQSEIQ